MATSLSLPSHTAPSNLHLRPSVQTRFVDSDMFDIAKRLDELSKALYIVEMTEYDDHAYAIMEHCVDGIDRLVFKVDALDARVIDRVREIMGVPFEHRFAVAEAAEDKHNAERKDNELEELYENLGRPMLTQLEHDGFIQRSVSYAKRGVASHGRMR